MRFSFSYIFNGLEPLKMATHPCIAEDLNKSDLPNKVNEHGHAL
jgi:hypothetical protein